MHRKPLRVAEIASPTLAIFLILYTVLFAQYSYAEEELAEFDSSQAKILVEKAVEYWRGHSSKMLAEMIVHRSDWQRRSKLRTWNEGTSKSLVRFIEPRKDAGNASLTVEDSVWTFSPKTNRAIKIPPSMKSQSWMGSDFSYQDLSKDDEIIDQYTHRLIKQEKTGAHTVYEVEATPKEDAPVVWGREVLRIRDDYIILSQVFYDQQDVAVKRLETKKIGMLGGRLYPITLRMTNLEEQDEWTEVVHLEANFDAKIDPAFFVVGNLRRR